MASIYTMKGDQGQTALGNNQRVSKTDPRIEVVGTIDELNAALGTAISHLPETSQVAKALIAIQHQLFTIGAHLAVPPGSDQKYVDRLPPIDPAVIESFEKVIDHWWEQLPELTGFILPGGSQAAAAVHLARAISRRAERRLILLDSINSVDPLFLRYFNRLSDLLFAAARFANHEGNQGDTLWHKPLA